MSAAIKLLVGLGNPGAEYAPTRHNAGAWLVERLCDTEGLKLKAESKFQGHSGALNIGSQRLHLLIPSTYMNHSGQAVRAISQFYKIKPEEICIAHDELDLPAGSVKIKLNGGHGGHNGLRDIIKHLGTQNFARIRLGIGHPGHRDKVHDYVLHRPGKVDANRIDESIDEALAQLTLLTAGNIQKAMLQLHTNQEAN